MPLPQPLPTYTKGVRDASSMRLCRHRDQWELQCSAEGLLLKKRPLAERPDGARRGHGNVAEAPRPEALIAERPHGAR